MGSISPPAWQAIAETVQGSIHKAIPSQWKLPDSLVKSLKHGSDVRNVPRTCGLLSKEEISITESSVTGLLSKLASGELSSVQVTTAFCARAAIAHQLVNCLTAYFSGEGLARAAELDAYLKREGKPMGPLHGLPIALKDTYDVPGKATTWGFAAAAGHRANRESAVVKILREAGAVFYVKTTMPQTGMALETVSPMFGRTLNPFNTDFVAGGSSGGDAALVAMHGSPWAPSTDIGGSIRGPAAFNGLYGIRPTADRIPKRGMQSVEHGQLNIRVSCGPICHNMEDLKILTKVVSDWPSSRYDTTSVPLPWREVPRPQRKLAFGYLEWDGAVMPDPPVVRAMRESVEKLKAQGHEVVKFDVPIDFWEASKVYFDIYFQCGSEDITNLLDKADEVPIPSVQELWKTYNVRKTSMSCKEMLENIYAQTQYRQIFADAWQATSTKTASGLPIDGLICPVSPSAGYKHDFLPYWGYTCFFNLIDYPSTVLPIKDFKINERDDASRKTGDGGYQPQTSNPFDQKYLEIYDPIAWKNQPVTIQIVGRPFDDEELVATTEVVDEIVNGS